MVVMIHVLISTKAPNPVRNMKSELIEKSSSALLEYS